MKIKLRIISILIIVFCVHWSSSAQNELINIESNNQGVIISRMDELARNNISNPDEGLLIFNNDSGKYNYYNGSEWEILQLAGPYGPQGPEGPPQTIPGGDGAQGPAGPQGDPGLKCWDANENGMNDSSEDIDLNGVFDIFDCIGPQGPFGPQGWSGPDGGEVFSIQVPFATSCIEFDNVHINHGPHLVFLHQVRQTTVSIFAVPDTKLSYNFTLNKWQVCALTGTLTAGTWYDIIALK